MRGRIYNQNGTDAGPAFDIGFGAANALDQQVQTAALHDGRFVVVWKTAAGEIAGQVMFADGTPDGAEFQVNTDTAGDQSRPTIAVLADGRFVVGFESGAGATPENIVLAIFDPREAGLLGSASALNDDWHGTNFADTVFLGVGDDRMSAAGGNDTIHGEAGNDFIFGDAGADELHGGNDGDTLDGGDDGDFLFGELGNDSIIGGSGNDSASGGDGNDTLRGGEGNDTLNGGTGNDSMEGGSGSDVYFVQSAGDIVIELPGGGKDLVNSFVTHTLAAGVENLKLAGALNINGTGNALANSITGSAGNNTLAGRAGNDTLTGGAGNDTLTGGTGNDSYAFDTDSALGTDTVTEASGGGTDTLNFTGSTNAVTVDLATTGNQTVNSNLTLNMTSAQVENVTGGNGNDTITGNTLNNSLSGGNGNDALAGGAGNDTLTGGSGNDSLSGDAGNDVLTGGAGDDTYSFNTNSSLGADTLTEAVGGGTDTLTFTGSTNDVVVNMALTGNQTVNSNLTLNMTSAQVDNVTGGDGNDTLTGNNLNNTITGGDGNDTLDGGAGNDTLTGGAGNDTLKTGSGVDTLDAGAGDDTIVITGTNETGDSADGGTGVNIFRFDVGATGVLSLTSNGEDTLDFSLFGNSVTIDLGNSSQQDVGGGLLLTLNGWFKNVIGSGNDDQITGNDADNNLDGGNGNDTLNGGSGNDTLNGEAGDDQLDGGAGTDSLDGGSEYDTAQNYNAEDTHTNIESGLPTPSPEEQTADKSSNTTDKENSSTIFLIEWGQEFTLPCTTTVVDAVTRDGHWLRFTGLCGYSVVLNHVDVSQLQDGIDSLGTPLGGVSVTLLQQGTIVNEIPFGSKVEFTFEVPAGFEGGAYFSNGDAEWVELPFVMVNDTHASISLQSTGTYAWFAR